MMRKQALVVHPAFVPSAEEPKPAAVAALAARRVSRLLPQVTRAAHRGGRGIDLDAYVLLAATAFLPQARGLNGGASDRSRAGLAESQARGQDGIGADELDRVLGARLAGSIQQGIQQVVGTHRVQGMRSCPACLTHVDMAQ